MTPAMVEKGNNTRKATADRKSRTDIRTALRSYMGLKLQDLQDAPADRVFEFLAKSLISVAARPGREQLRALQEIMDRLHGKSKIALDDPKAVMTRADLRQTIDATDLQDAEAVLRKAGLDGMANELALYNDAEDPERDTEGDE